jgi:hypothetical protein
MGVKKSNGGLVGEKDFLKPKEIKRTTDGLMEMIGGEGTSNQQQEARGLLAQISRARGSGEPTYVDVGQRDQETGEVPIERGIINTEGEKVPDN